MGFIDNVTRAAYVSGLDPQSDPAELRKLRLIRLTEELQQKLPGLIQALGDNARWRYSMWGPVASADAYLELENFNRDDWTEHKMAQDQILTSVRQKEPMARSVGINTQEPDKLRVFVFFAQNLT